MGLAIRNLTVSLGGRQILHQATFDVADGELLSLLGPSGAGKTTLIKAIAGILYPDSGTIAIDGTVVNDLPAHQRRAPVVFQDIRLFPNMNVEENIAFPLRMQGVRRKERMAQAREILELMHLEDLGGRRINEVSGGQQQRVALGRALAGNPRVLLLDEPFSSLDEGLREEMRDLVLEIHRRLRITTVLVTHDAREALLLSDHIVYLQDGWVVQRGTPADLYECPAGPEVAGCFGDCTTIRGTIKGRVFQAGGLRVGVSASVAPSGEPEIPATAIIRQGGVCLTPGGDLAVIDSTYCGDGYLVRVNTGKDTLTARSSRAFSPGERVAAEVSAGAFFCFADPAPSEKATD